jgi:hypothetical protein
MIAALSLTNKYPGFSPGNKVHKYYFGVWTLSGLRMWFVFTRKQAGWMAKSKVVSDYKLEHTNKELDGRLTSLLLLARFFFSAVMLRDRVHLPNVLVRSLACIIAPSTWYFRFELLPYSLASHASMIFLQNKALAGPPCLYFACGLIKYVRGASRDVSWCMYG